MPSFNALTVALWHVVISFVDQGVFQKVDAFMQDNPEILNHIPTSLKVTQACNLVEVSSYVFISFVPRLSSALFLGRGAGDSLGARLHIHRSRTLLCLLI